jgi:5-methylthioadenosine/S-adenosylhomocysteine deaminase
MMGRGPTDCCAVAAPPGTVRVVVSAPATRRPDGAELVVRADWVLTVDDRDTVLVDGAVVLAGDRIVDVGVAAEVLEERRGVPVEHLRGHALLPGLVNTHTHLAMTMFRGLADDRDLERFLATVVPVEARVLSAARVEAATRAGAVESVLAGVTTALDMYFFVDAGLRAAAEVGLRMLAGPVMFDGGPGDLAWDRLLGWAEEWLDRHPAGGGWRPVLGPHATYTVTPAQLAEVRDLARGHGALVHIHVAETAAECETVAARHGRRPVGILEQSGLLERGTVLAHAVHLHDAELAAIAAGGAGVAHCPASNLKLASGLARVPELVAAGVPVGLGTDGPASSNDLDLLAAARLAALVHKGIGAPGTGGDATRLPAAAVIRMATREGARVLGLEDQLGSIEAGKLADLVAVDLDRPHTQPVYDPASAIVYASGRGDVRHVWVGGRRVVDRGRTVSVDEARVTAELRGLQRDVVG